MFPPVVDTSPDEDAGRAGTEVTDRTKPQHPPLWTIALSDDVATHQRLIATLRAAPARLIPDDHHTRADIRLVASTEPAASAGRVPQVVVADIVDEIVVRAVMRSGAAGIMTPDITVEEAQMILAAIAIGWFPVPHHLAVALATSLEPATPAGLTKRDRIILEHLAHGDTTRVIAQHLGCSQRHTRRHLRALWDKMGVDGRAQGLVTATRQGLLTP